MLHTDKTQLANKRGCQRHHLKNSVSEYPHTGSSFPKSPKMLLRVYERPKPSSMHGQILKYHIQYKRLVNLGLRLYVLFLSTVFFVQFSSFPTHKVALSIRKLQVK